MKTRTMSGAVFGAMLAGSLAQLAGAAQQDDPRVQFVQDLTQQASQDPKMGKELQAYMKGNSLTPSILVDKKLGRPTPANIQQYPGASKEGDQSGTLFASDYQARMVLDRAGTLVESARKQAKDAPKKFVAEKGGEVVTILGDTYNEVALETMRRINSVRAKLSEMVAVAVVVNGGGGAGAKTAPGQKVQKGLAERGKTTAIIDAAFGQSVMNLVRPEIPLGRYGRQLWEEARKETAGLPEFINSKLANLDKAQKLSKELIAKESSYRRGMQKGSSDAAGGLVGSSGTGQVLSAAVDSLGGHFVAINREVAKLNAFIIGPGSKILDVLRCSEVTYEAAYALTVEESEESRMAKANIAYDANVLAARGVGPMVSQWAAEITSLGNVADGGLISPPGYKGAAEVRAGQSRSGKDVSGKAHATAETLQGQ